MEIKHFENLWEEAEGLSKEDSKEELSTLLDLLVSTCQQMKTCPEESRPDSFGQVLFLLCTVSKKLNINAYAALKNAMDDYREDILDP